MRWALTDVLTGARAETYRERTIQSAIHIPSETPDCLMSETDLKPTEEQRDVIKEICADIASDQPMLRLLSADVGFGKTYVAAAAGAAFVRSFGKVVWLCPNQPLAVQTRDNIAGWWPDLVPGLVVGDSKEMPDSKFLIGTTALHHRLPKDFHPNLLVIDESQKFGTLQKDGLAGPATNILNATATCIPRTNISHIRMMPPKFSGPSIILVPQIISLACQVLRLNLGIMHVLGGFILVSYSIRNWLIL